VSVARVFELAGHPFYIATLFVPQNRSTIEKPHPLVTALLSSGVNRTRRATALDSPVFRRGQGEFGRIEYGGLPVTHAMFPNCPCDNSFRDATYDEVYSASDF
jgi:hypothetical protein